MSTRDLKEKPLAEPVPEVKWEGAGPRSLSLSEARGMAIEVLLEAEAERVRFAEDEAEAAAVWEEQG